MHTYGSYERPRKVRLPTPDWWTAIFSGILALTAVAALWYARDQIKKTVKSPKSRLGKGANRLKSSIYLPW